MKLLDMIAERMEIVRNEGVGKGWAGKWLKVDLSYKVWKVTSSPSIEYTLVWFGLYPFTQAKICKRAVAAGVSSCELFTSETELQNGSSRYVYC